MPLRQSVGHGCEYNGARLWFQPLSRILPFAVQQGSRGRTTALRALAVASIDMAELVSLSLWSIPQRELLKVVGQVEAVWGGRALPMRILSLCSFGRWPSTVVLDL